MSYASTNKLTIRAVGFEPTTTRSQSEWHEPGLPTPLRNEHICGRTRTYTLQFWRPTLRQLSYADKAAQAFANCAMTSVRFERTIPCISDRCSNQVELRGRYLFIRNPPVKSRTLSPIELRGRMGNFPTCLSDVRDRHRTCNLPVKSRML